MDAFQTGKVVVFLASILAANTGLTLTRSSTVVIVEMPASSLPAFREKVGSEGKLEILSDASAQRLKLRIEVVRE